MSRSGLAALSLVLLLASCGGSRSPNESPVPSANGDMTVTQSGPTTVGAGGTATFNAVVLNAGRTDVSNITVTQTLSGTYTTAVGCVASPGATCPTQLGAIIVVPSLPAGRWLTLSYQIQVPTDARGDIEIDHAEVHAQIDVIARRKLEHPRLAPAPRFAVVLLSTAVGDALVRQIG